MQIDPGWIHTFFTLYSLFSDHRRALFIYCSKKIDES